MKAGSPVYTTAPSIKELTYSGFRLQENGLIPVGIPTKDEWFTCLYYLLHMEKHVHFWIGDLLNYGEQRWGQRYTQMLTKTDYSYGTLRNIKYVASHIDVSRRHDNLSFAHHQEVARLPPDKQTTVLERAEANGWTRELTRREAHRLNCEALRPRTPPFLPGLYHNDCVQVMNTLPDDSVDLLLTDPPYGIGYHSEHRTVPQLKLANDGEDAAEAILDQALSVASRKLKLNSHVYIFSSWRTDARMKPIVAKYFEIRNVLIWEKNNWAAGDLEGSYAKKYEGIIFAHKGRRHLNGSVEADVLHFDRVPENTPNRHPTQKPIKLLEYLISKSTKEGETVLDCFMGVGSTCLAAKRTNRNYIGIELEKQWYDLAVLRLS